MTDSGFIDGIYNYCDRWCDKCRFKPRCMSYVMGEKLKESVNLNSVKIKSLKRRERMDSEKESVPNGGTIAIHMSGESKKQSEQFTRIAWEEDYEKLENEDAGVARLVDEEDANRCDQIYELLADETLKRIYLWFDSEEIQRGVFPRIAGVEHALLEVNWYMELIYSKLRRAFYGYHIYSDKLNAIKEEEDYNGSAKMALISIGTSKKAWQVLAGYLPEFTKSISYLVAILEQIQSEIERVFPDAYRFKRPGFDR